MEPLYMLALVVLKHIGTALEDDGHDDNQAFVGLVKHSRRLSFEEDKEMIFQMMTMHQEVDSVEDDLMFLNLLFFLVQNYQLEVEDTFVFSRNRHVFHKSLNEYQRKIRDRRIERNALLNRYTPHPDPRKLTLIKQKGHRRKQSASDVLGLYLAWTRTKGSTIALGLVFGMTSSSVFRYLHFGRRILICILKRHPDAAVRVPNTARIYECIHAIHNRHNYLLDVWCFLDGLQLHCDKSTIPAKQRVFYNGWKSDHFVKGVFVFTPDGKIVMACYNIPGNVHDSQICHYGNIYRKIQQVYGACGARAVGDSAFASARNPSIIKSSQYYNGGQPNQQPDFADMTDEEIHEWMTNRQATSLRQAAEWGMLGLQTSFPRIADKLRYEEYCERKYIMKSCVLLWNYRVSTVGINQIRNVYMPHLNQNADGMFPNNQ